MAEIVDASELEYMHPGAASGSKYGKLLQQLEALEPGEALVMDKEEQSWPGADNGSHASLYQMLSRYSKRGILKRKYSVRKLKDSDQVAITPRL